MKLISNRKSVDVFDALYLVIGGLAFFMMVVTSRGFTKTKIVLLLLLCIISFGEMIIRHKGIPDRFLKYILLFVTYYMFNLLWGILNGYAFSFSADSALLRYYLETPIVALMTAMICKNKEYRFKSILNLLKYITLFAVVGDTLKVAFLSGWIPNFDVLNLFYVGNQDFVNVRTRMSNEPSLMFLLPMYLYLFFQGDNSIKDRIIYTFILLFGGIYVILSGRRALELVVGLTLVIIVILNIKRLGRKQIKRLSLIILALIVLFIAINIVADKMGIANIVQTATRSFTEGFGLKYGGMTKRTGNAKGLFELFLSSPIIGNGLNSYAVSSVASKTHSWSYEVYYNALLAQTGLIGIGLLFAGIYKLVKEYYLAYKITNNHNLIGIVFGLVMFIISSASNPFIAETWVWCLAFSAWIACHDIRIQHMRLENGFER